MAENTCTVAGVFEDYATAESVARDLANVGIPRNQIDVRSNFKTGTAGGGEGYEGHEGGVTGFFHRLFGGHEDADHYSEAVRRGSAVVCVKAAPEQIDQAVALMNERGAIDIDRRVSQYRETGYERHDAKAPAYSYDEARNERDRFTKEGGSIPVVEEELQVGKRTVQKGGVRVYSRVIEQPVDQSVELREEHVRVERRPVDRSISPGEVDRLRDQSVEVTEMSEEPVVQKRARVREEVVVGKETTKRTQKVTDKVRRTEVNVEPIKGESTDGGSVATDTDEYRRDYDYGYTLASDERYRGRRWADAEDEVRTEYMRRNPNSTWERAKESVRHGWEKVTGSR